MSRFKNETTITDHDTGEIVTTAKYFSIPAKTTDEFYMVFIQFMAPVAKIKSACDIQVLHRLCMLMTYNSPKVSLTMAARKKLMDDLGLNKQNMSRSLRRLTDLGVITGENGEYEVNPMFFWKGTTESRKKLLREEGLELKIRFGGQQS